MKTILKMMVPGLMVVLIMAGMTFKGLRDAYNWVRHTHEVIFEIERIDLQSKLGKVEIRQHLFDNSEAKLRQIANRRAEAEKGIHEFIRLTQDNAAQQVNASRLIDLNRIIWADIEQAGISNNSDFVNNAESLETTRQYLILLQAMKQEEYRLLDIRMNKSYSQIKMSGFWVVFSLSMTLFITAIGIRSSAKLQIATQQKNLMESHAEELKKSNAELQQFAYVASHDLQEPLRMISSYMSLLERRYKDKLDSKALEYIGFAVNGASRMKDLIDDLLQYSRIGSTAKNFERVEMSQLIRDVIDDLQQAISESGTELKICDAPPVMGDEVQLRQLFQNLIVNAIKFRSEKPPSIEITCSQQNTTVGFQVRDNGIGIAKDHFEKIFVIFQRLHTKEEYPGTGMGLAICKKVVERHGGRMWVESEPGSGSSFNFTLQGIMDEDQHKNSVHRG